MYLATHKGMEIIFHKFIYTAVMCDIHDMNIHYDINDGRMIYEIFLYRDFKGGGTGGL